ncbi:unnamed protein product [Lactuca virosa]|uniref:Uncharacterized protein n=1 Tax=Lactuca virosa TaxID=75947 RepID=A0AAU9PTN3_9ASTR|nr:unnamed protein product [Lactuca virosa]
MDQHQLKMDQKMEEILGALSKNRATTHHGKTTEEEQPSISPIPSIEETPKVYSGASHSDTGGTRSRNGGEKATPGEPTGDIGSWICLCSTMKTAMGGS